MNKFTLVVILAITSLFGNAVFAREMPVISQFDLRQYKCSTCKTKSHGGVYDREICHRCHDRGVYRDSDGKVIDPWKDYER